MSSNYRSEREWGAAQNFEAMTHTQSSSDETFLASQKQRESPDYIFVLSYKGTSTENRISRTLEEKKRRRTAAPYVLKVKHVQSCEEKKGTKEKRKEN